MNFWEILIRAATWAVAIAIVVLAFVLLAERLPDVESNNMDMSPIPAQPASAR